MECRIPNSILVQRYMYLFGDIGSAFTFSSYLQKSFNLSNYWNVKYTCNAAVFSFKNVRISSRNHFEVLKNCMSFSLNEGISGMVLWDIQLICRQGTTLHTVLRLQCLTAPAFFWSVLLQSYCTELTKIKCIFFFQIRHTKHSIYF